MSASLFSGKTVEDAIAEGLRALGLRQSEAEIEVVSRGSRGLFGIGSEPAQADHAAPGRRAGSAGCTAAGRRARSAPCRRGAS